MSMNDHSFTRNGTVGGTLAIILANITSADAVKTIVLAALGAAVSFFVSYVLKRMMKKRK
jgi:hypothetical protein